MVPAHPPTPPPIPTTVALPPPAAPSRRNGVPAWATSFGVHCLAIILLGLYTYREKIAGTRGLLDVALSWQEPSGEEQLDFDSGALLGKEAVAVEISPSRDPNELSATTLERFAQLTTTPTELKLEVSGKAKSSSQSIAELSGLLGAGKAQSGQGTDFGKGHGYGKTKFFGLESEGSKFVYVFDRSYSMNEYNHTPLQAAKQELISSIEQLSEQQQFYIVFYNHEPFWYQPRGGYSRGRLQFATGENKSRLREFMYGVTADGGTRHMPALEAAVSRRPDVIYLLTDGEEKDDPTVQELQHITRMNSGGASIHVIQFALEPRPNSTLVQLAKRNHGKHTFIDIQRLAERLAAAAGQNAIP